MSLSWGMCPLVEAENTLLDEDDLSQREEREAAEDRNTILETRLFFYLKCTIQNKEEENLKKGTYRFDMRLD
jgi:hypothetical protein